MKKALLSLAVAVLSANAAFALSPQPTRFVYHPGPDADDAFYITEAYLISSDCPLPSAPGSEMGVVPGKGPVSDNRCWTGVDTEGNNTQSEEDNIKGVPGILCLGNREQTFDVNDFVTGFKPFVQNFRLIKEIPLAPKCPDTFSGARFTQFGPDVRTWWTLIYTAPGTTFTLEIDVVDTMEPGFEMQPRLHKEVWRWEVVATFESLTAVIHNLHQNTLGTAEVPCISGEEMASTLLDQVEAIRAAQSQEAENQKQVDLGQAVDLDAAAAIMSQKERADAQDAIFEFESLITSFCSFVTFFIPEECFSQQFPPSDEIQFGDFGFTGIIDSSENPCCCKLLADIDYIGVHYGIVGR